MANFDHRASDDSKKFDEANKLPHGEIQANVIMPTIMLKIL